MKKKRAALGGIGVLAVLCMGGGALAACGKGLSEFPPYDYDYNTPAKDFGDGIAIDGKLEESVWSGQRKFTSRDIKGYGVNFSMTSYFGEKGAYFAFDVDAPAVAYNPDRDMYNNAGVEVRIGSPEKLSMTYEIGLYAGGNKVMRKYNPAGGNSGYTDYIYQIDSAVQTKGEINTSACKGYTVELYLPYNLFNADNSFTKPDHLLAAPAIIHSSNSSLNIGRDFYYDIGGEELGLSWAPASSDWLHYASDGLVCNDATLISSEGGALNGKDYILYGDTYVLGILPNEGYYCASLRANGKDVTDEIVYTGGKAQYKVKTTAQDMKFEAQFAPLPQTKHTLSGVVTVEGGDISKAKLYACYSGAVTEIPVGENGAFSASLPEGEYTLLCEGAGFLTVSEKVVLNADAQRNVSLVKLFLGASEVIGSASEDSSWDFSRLGEGIAVCKDNGWLVSANHTTLYGEKMFVSADIVMNALGGGDPRTGFRFVDKTGKGYFVSLHAFYNTSAPEYRVQIVALNQSGVPDNGWLSEVALIGDHFHAPATGGGLPFAVLYDNGKITAWVNGEKIVNEYQSDIAIGADKKVVPALTACGGGTYRNLEFATEAFENGYPVHIASEGRGTVSCDKQTYQAGDTLTFTVIPKQGYAVQALTVNGEDKLSELNGSTLTVAAGSRTAIAVFVTFAEITEQNGVLSGAVTLNGEAFAQETVITLTNVATGASAELTATDGTYAFPSLPAGIYDLTAEADGGYAYSARVTIAGSTQHTIALKRVSMAEKYGASGDVDHFDIEKIEEGKAVYTANASAGESHLRFEKLHVKGSQDFYIESVMRLQSGFILNADGGNRQGYSIYTATGGEVHLTVGRWGTGDSWSLMMNNWGDVDKKIALSAAQAAAYESANGLKIAAARIDGTLYLFAEENGAMKQIVSSAWSAGASADLFLGLGVWYQNQSAEFNGLNWKIADGVPVDVAITQGDHGTLTVSPHPVMGASAVITVTPDEGYTIGALTVNGVTQTEFVKEDGSYRITLENYLSKQLNVSVTFEVEADLNVTLLLDGVPDGVTVSLHGVETYPAVAVSGGKAVFANVKKGTYTVKAEGYRDVSVTLTKNGETEVELRKITAAEKYQAAGDTDRYALEEANGKLNVTYTGTGGSDADSYGVTLGAYAVGANEDVYVSTVIREQASFGGDYLSNLRYGLIFQGAGRSLNFDLGCWGSYNASLVDWGVVNQETQLEQSMIDAYKSAAGLKIAAARINGKFYLYMGAGSDMKLMAQGEHAALSRAEMSVGVMTWWQASGAEYQDFVCKKGAQIPELEITASAVGHGTVTAAQNVKPGGDITVTVTPDRGATEYVCSSLTVNGTEKISDCTKNADGTLTLNLPAWLSTLKVQIVATFIERSEFSVSLNVLLHRLGAGTDNLSALPDGTEVTLSGPKTYTAAVQDGSVSFASVQKGTYTVSADVEGYNGYPLNVTGALTNTQVKLEYNLIESGTRADLSGMNDGTIRLNLAQTNGAHDRLKFTQGVAANENFMVTAVFQNVLTASPSGLRLGFFAGTGGCGVEWGGMSAASESVDFHLMFETWNGNAMSMTWQGTQLSVSLTESECAALQGSAGLRLGIARVNGAYWLLKEENGGLRAMQKLTVDGSALMTGAVSVGFYSNEGNQTESAVKLEGLQYATGASVDLTQEIAFANTQCGGVYLVTDDTLAWKTQWGSVAQHQVNGDFTKYQTERKITWNTDAKENVYFVDGISRLTLDYTLKADIPSGKRITAFVIWDGGTSPAPFVVTLAHESDGTYLIQLIRHWSWDGAQSYTLTEAQIAKLKGEGLALRIVRDQLKVVVFDNSGAEAQWLCERTYEAESVMAAMGVGVSGSAAEFTGITVTEGCPWDT